MWGLQHKIFYSLVIGILLLVGCGNQTIIGNSSPAVESKLTKEQIIFWHTYNEAETHIFETIILPLFEAEYPMIEVKPVRHHYNMQLRSAIISRASTGKPPDVIRLDINWTPAIAQLDLLYPVSEFEDFEKLKGQYYEAPLQSNYYNGKYYGVPLNIFTKASIYNKELLEASKEDPPKTMDELIDIVERNQFVISMDHFSIWGSLHYFYGLGGQLLDHNYTKATGYLDSENSVNAVLKLLDLFQKGNLVTHGNRWFNVLDGQNFVIDEGPWFYSSYSLEQITSINKVTVAAPFPISNGKRAILGGENIVISKAAKHKDAAWTFIKWLTDIDAQTHMAQTGLMPTNKYVNLSGAFDETPYYQPYLDSVSSAFLPPSVPQFENINEIYSHYLELIFLENISVEEGLSEAAKEIDEILLSNSFD
ncbi:hypothetical protein BKP37_03090 [Anaerobacillus alkalilacustris]|uniref:ABC transporter substrate-binding protein n=1 Tax=Anaerobacillus alkalilacustris TaxID=393763 RepID=A0A1S2LYA3_9BACI|nr:extracellular solute-binding protein [Anaerobacillus alkalilacustris]OIJ17492.1 hypothetical protein BKP37_03090 [Anaerobacillus alkalilacustris]